MIYSPASVADVTGTLSGTLAYVSYDGLSHGVEMWGHLFPSPTLLRRACFVSARRSQEYSNLSGSA